jgi:O-antigen ligase
MTVLSSIPFLTTLVVNPWSNFEPIALPKIFLSSFVFSALLLALGLSPIPSKFQEKKIPITLFVSLLSIVVSLMIHQVSFAERLFGVFGRSTGAFHYLILILCAILFFFSAQRILNYFFLSLSFTYFFVVIHSLLQWRGWDFYEWALPTNNRIFSTLGNPNILSSFLSFSSFGVAWLLLRKNRVSIFRLFLTTCSIGLTLFIIIASGSGLGLLSLFGGLLFLVIHGALLHHGKISRPNKFWTSTAAITIFVGAAYFISRIQIIDFQGSIVRRLEFWRTGIAIFESSPIFGIGFDRYSDLFTQFFTTESGLLNIRSSSAHNFWIDVLASGGLLLFLPFLAVQLMVVLCIVRNWREIKALSPQAILIAAWIAFSIQSFISVQSLAVGLWGWAMTGILLSLTNSPNAGMRFKFNLLSRLSVLTLALLTLTLNWQSFQADRKFYEDARSQDGNALVDQVLAWPQDSYRIFLTAEALRKASQDAISSRIEQEGLRINPENLNLLRLVANYESDPVLRKKAIAKLKILDPAYVVPNRG